MRKQRKLRIGLQLNKMDSFFIVLVSCLLVLVAILFNYFSYNVEKSETELIRLVLEKMSENEKTQFESYVDQKVEVLKALVTYEDVYTMEKERQKEFLRGKARKYGFEYFFVVYAEGFGYYLDEGAGVTRNQKNEPFFGHVMNNEVYLTEPFYTNSGPAITTVSVSIYDENRNKVGVLCGALNLENIQKVIKENEMVLDGGCFILNDQGQSISSNMNFDVHSGKTIYGLKNSDFTLIKQAFSKRQDMDGEIKISRIHYQAHITYLSDFNWVMVQCIPMEEITARFVYIQGLQVAMIVLTVALLACLARIIYSWKKSDRRIYMDTLTGCNSRAAVLRLMDSLEKRNRARISMIYMDLNHFKCVNDTYGHEAGDQLLRIFGETLKEVFRKNGFVGRMGGDEFVAILSDAGDDEIISMCQSVEEILAEKSLQLDFSYRISSSYGYASREAGQDMDMTELLQYADERMYENKALTRGAKNE